MSALGLLARAIAGLSLAALVSCESELAERYRVACEARKTAQLQQGCRIVTADCDVDVDAIGIEEEGVEQQECLAEQVSCDERGEQVPSAEELCGPAYVCFGRCGT